MWGVVDSRAKPERVQGVKNRPEPEFLTLRKAYLPWTGYPVHVLAVNFVGDSHSCMHFLLVLLNPSAVFHQCGHIKQSLTIKLVVDSYIMFHHV